MASFRPSASVRRFPVDGGLLLLDQLTNRLFAYNETARHVWELIGSGRVGDELASEFAQAWKIPLQLARNDVESILALWRMQGLLTTGETQSRSPAPATGAGTAGDELPKPPPCASEWTCTISKTTIAFAGEPELTAPIRAMLAHLETPGAAPVARIEIRNNTGTQKLLIVDGAERLRTSEDALLVGGLWQTVLERVHPDAKWLALVHGAAVARDGRALALCGPSGSGKSTLTAALTGAGFDFLADDLVAVSAPDAAIKPWPVPISIKSGSFDAVTQHRPELAWAATYHTKGVEARLLVPPLPAWESEPVRLRRLLFPHFRQGAAPQLSRLTTFEALERLLKDRIWLGFPITADRVNALLAVLNDTPAYAATYGALADGIRMVENIV